MDALPRLVCAGWEGSGSDGEEPEARRLAAARQRAWNSKVVLLLEEVDLSTGWGRHHLGGVLK